MFDPIADKLMVLICLVMLISADVITLAHLPAADYHRARDIGVGHAGVFEQARSHAARFNIGEI